MYTKIERQVLNLNANLEKGKKIKETDEMGGGIIRGKRG